MSESGPNPPVVQPRDLSQSTGGIRRTRTTWAAYLVLGLFAYLETAIGPSMPFLREKLDLDFTMASIHFSAFAAGIITAGIQGDRVLRRIGRRAGLWGGIAGMVCGAALLVLSPSVAGTLPGVFIMGSSGTLSLVSNQTILSDLHPTQRTVALTESNVVASSAAILAPLAIGGFARFGFGWQTALLITIPVLGILVWRFGRVVIPEPPPKVKQADQQDALPRIFWMLFVVLFLCLCAEWCIAYWGADFLADEVGLERSAAATAMSVFFGAMIAGRMVGARLSRRYAASRLLLAALIVAIAGFPVFWLGQVNWINLIGLFITGAGIANFYPLTVGAATTAVPAAVDQVTTRLAISGGGALLLAPLVVGSLADAVDLQAGLGIVMPLLMLALALVVSIDRSSHGHAVSAR